MKLIPLQDIAPEALVPLLRETVQLGASIGWTATPDEAAAQTFWQRCQDSCRRGERQGFVALESTAAGVTVSTRVSVSKLAWTDLTASIVTTQVVRPVHAPDQPVKAELPPGDAVSVTSCPAL